MLLSTIISLIKNILKYIIYTFVILSILSVYGVDTTGIVASLGIAGLVIGLTLVLVHLIGIGLTGTSVNPARSLGPAFVLWGTAIKQVWVFIVGPIVGSLVAGYLYKYLKAKSK